MSAPAWSPAAIVAAIKRIDPVKANAILASLDDVTKAEFFTARQVAADEPRLLDALNAAGITIEQLSAAITDAS